MVGFAGIIIVILALHSLYSLSKKVLTKGWKILKAEFVETKDYFFGSSPVCPADFSPSEFTLGPAEECGTSKIPLSEGSSFKVLRRGEEANLSVYHFEDASMILPK